MSKPLQRLVALTCVVLLAALAVYAIDTLHSRSEARKAAEVETFQSIDRLGRDLGVR